MKSFFPQVQQTRFETGSIGPAILILVRCSAHDSDHFHEQCRYDSMIPHFLPAHRSYQMQLLHLVTFWVQNSNFNRMSAHRGLRKQSSNILRMLEFLWTAATPSIGVWSNSQSSSRMQFPSRIVIKTQGKTTVGIPHRECFSHFIFGHRHRRLFEVLEWLLLYC
jgi:hypothetical protein